MEEDKKFYDLVFANGREYKQIPDGGKERCKDCCFCVGDNYCRKPDAIIEPDADQMDHGCKSYFYEEVKVDIGKDTAQRALAVLRRFCHVLCGKNDSGCHKCAARHVIVELAGMLGGGLTEEEEKKFIG